MTYQEALNLYQFIAGWNDPLDATLAYKLAQIKILLIKPLQKYSLMLSNIQKEYKIDKSQMSPALKAEYEEKVAQIWNSELEVDVPFILLDDLHDLKFCIESMTALLPIIKEQG